MDPMGFNFQTDSTFRVFKTLKFFPKKKRGDPAGVRNPRDQTRQKTHWARETQVFVFGGKVERFATKKKGETQKQYSPEN